MTGRSEGDDDFEVLEDEPVRPGGIEIVGALDEDLPAGASLDVTLRDPVQFQRYRLSLILLVVTVGLSVVVVAVALGVSTERWTRINGLVPLVLTPFQTLLGAAIGWYFGGRDSKG